MPTKSTATISSVIEQSGGFILRTPEKERFISCDTKPSVVNIWEKNNNEDRYTSLNKTFFIIIWLIYKIWTKEKSKDQRYYKSPLKSN